MENEHQGIQDDGLPCPEVGAWADTKHRLISLYASLFATGMKRKWDKRVYVDLYSGSGYARVRDTSRIIQGSPLLALTVKDPFDKYIFCEEDPALLAALKQRVLRIAPNAEVAYVDGDCNSEVGRIIAEIPQASRNSTVLSLCVVDPFDIGIKFETLKRLSDRFVDFLCLLALHMDANRAYSWYVKEKSVKVDDFLGSRAWRDAWAAAQAERIGFPKFLATTFAEQMQTIGYIAQPMHRMKQVRADDNNRPLYHLALFSRSQLAYQYWDEVLKYSTDQTSLF